MTCPLIASALLLQVTRADVGHKRVLGARGRGRDDILE